MLNFPKIPGVEIQYLCDPDPKQSSADASKLINAGHKSPKIVSDLRKILDKSEIQAVILATPDHWHAPSAILACEAGKHVYFEKPWSHNIKEERNREDREGRQMQSIDLAIPNCLFATFAPSREYRLATCNPSSVSKVCLIDVSAKYRSLESRQFDSGRIGCQFLAPSAPNRQHCGI